MTLAAAPAWFADNVAQIALVTLVVATVLVIRLVQKATLRLALVAVIAVVALVVWVNRAPLQVCARTCECQIADRDITVPLCNPDIEL